MYLKVVISDSIDIPLEDLKNALKVMLQSYGRRFKFVNYHLHWPCFKGRIRNDLEAGRVWIRTNNLVLRLGSGLT
jgi:hypothetical protein